MSSISEHISSPWPVTMALDRSCETISPAAVGPIKPKPNQEQTMTFVTTLQRLDIFKNSVAVIAWVCLFCYSIYLTVDAYANTRPFTPLHVIIPFVLLLLCIRSSIRLAHRLKARAQA